MYAAQTCPDPAAFKEELQQYFTDIQAEQAWVETNGAEAMSAVLELVRRHKARTALYSILRKTVDTLMQTFQMQELGLLRPVLDLSAG